MFLEFPVMCKAITFVLAFGTICGFAPVAQATFLADFEAPAYTAGSPVDGQNGWIAASRSGAPAPNVVAVPTGYPEVLGGQCTEIGSYYTDHSLVGTGFTDVTSISLMTGYIPGNGNLRFAFYGPSLSGTTGKVAQFYINDNNKITYFSDAERTLVDLASSDAKLWKLNLSLDFTSGKYEGIWTDLGTSTSYSTGWMGFMNPCTLAQAQASAYFSCDRANGSSGPQYLDNLSVGQVPEPMTSILLLSATFGLTLYAWRKRR
jgi:hypothetical protein